MSINSWVDYIQGRLQLLDGKLYVKYFVSLYYYYYLFIWTIDILNLKLLPKNIFGIKQYTPIELPFKLYIEKKISQFESSDLHGEQNKVKLIAQRAQENHFKP